MEGPLSETLPEHLELQRKGKELEEKQALLAERELDLATLRAELQSFEGRYLQEVGVLYARLDQLEAELAHLRARRNPASAELKAKAREAHVRAEESAREAGRRDVDNGIPLVDFAPSPDLKRHYRELAKRLHPDLTLDHKERERRTRAMAEVNEAYAAGDEGRLRRIWEEWQASPESVEGEGVAAELIRFIRRIAQVEKRLGQIEEQIQQLRKSDLHRLWREAMEATEQGRDLQDEMASYLEGQIDKAGAAIRREREAAATKLV